MSRPSGGVRQRMRTLKPTRFRLTLTSALLILITYAVAGITARYGALDFGVYRAGGEVLMGNPAGLYAPGIGGEFNSGLPFTYPPFAAALFTVFAVLPFWVGYSLLVIASLVFLWFIAKDLAPRFQRFVPAAGDWLGAPMVFVLLLCSGPVRDTIAYGQVNVILMGALYLSFVKSRTLIPFAVALGVCSGVKLTPLAMLILPLALGRIIPIVVGIGTFLGTQALGYLVWPQQTVAFWTDAVVDPSRVGDVGFIDNLAIRGVIERLGLSTVWWAVLFLLVAVLTLLAISRNKDRLSRPSQLGLAALCGLLISPVSWSHHWVWIPLLVLAMVEVAPTLSSAVRKVLRVAGIYVAVFSFVTPKAAVMAFGLDTDFPLPGWGYLFDAAFVLSALLCLALIATAPRRAVR